MRGRFESACLKGRSLCGRLESACTKGRSLCGRREGACTKRRSRGGKLQQAASEQGVWFGLEKNRFPQLADTFRAGHLPLD